MPRRAAMPLEPLPITDTRSLFRPLGRELVARLRELPAPAWERPTVAGSWRVRDVVAHLTDTALRRLSGHRDGEGVRPAGGPPPTESEIGALVNGLNASWVAAARRFSPRVLTEMYRSALEELSDFFEGLPADAPALFPVSWAGEEASAGWFDVAREFTEQWHHHAQIREAAGWPPFSEPAWLRAVLETAVRGLPHAYRAVAAETGAWCAIEVSGPSGGAWTLRREPERWTIWTGVEPSDGASGRVGLSDETAWRLWFNALSPEEADRRVKRSGDARLTSPFLGARSVIL